MGEKEILQLIDNREFPRVKEVLANMNCADIAEIFAQLDKTNISIIFRLLKKDEAADVFAYLDPDTQKTLVVSLSDKEIGHIINDLFLDDAVDFIEEMPAVVVPRILKNANEETRNQINLFLQYGENSAGSMMTNEFVDLKQNLTVAEAFDVIRAKAVDKETIYTCYVKDDTRRLIGIVTVKQLLLAAKGTAVSKLMEKNIICVKTTDDREILTAMFEKYGLLAIPVVDSEERLVGIVTIDDALTVLKEEATEDIEKMAALKPSERPYLQTSVFRLAANRIVWLLVLMVSAMLTGFIIEGFENTIAVLPILVGFIPLLMDTGGNAGSQSSALVIRGMAVGEIKTQDVGKVLWKELRVALLIGVVLAAFIVLRVLIFNGDPSKLVIGTHQNHPIQLGLAVAFSLVCTVVMAKILGGLLPIAAKAIKMDPAIMAAPLITTIVDALSLVVYFGLLKLLISGL